MILFSFFILNFVSGPFLYLPKNLVFSDNLDESQHVVYIEYGNVTVYNSDVFNHKDVPFYQSLSRPEVSLLIPLLSNHPDGPPRFSLALDKLYTHNWSDLLNINIVFHHETVDKISVNMNEAVVRDDSEELRININWKNNSCQPATSSIRQKFDMVLEQELMLGISQPKFPTVCDFLEKNYFCSVTNSIRDEVISFAPNVCQIPWGPSTSTSCKCHWKSSISLLGSENVYSFVERIPSTSLLPKVMNSTLI